MHNPEPFSCFPPEVLALMKRIGPVWSSNARLHRDQTLQALDPFLRAAPPGGVKITRDVAYGADPRQVMDLYRPAVAGPAPIVVFVHGGAFVRGNKQINEFVYGNVTTWFARQGYLGVNMEYRLAPGALYPSGIEDVAAVVRWLGESAPAHGGDPSRIFLMAHSAGGAHVAGYAYDPAQGHLGRGVRGVVLVSSRVRADALPENPNAAAVRTYYGEDESLYDARSPVTHAGSGELPVFVAFAEFENPLLDVYSLELAWRRSQHMRRAPPVLRLRHHNHMSIVAHFNTEDEILGRAILEFFEGCA
ncbi:MAG: alpha/beta hydrolase [Lautropia sp.]